MQECPEYCRRGTPDFVRTKSIEIDVDEMAHPFPFFHPFIPYVKKDGERDFKNFRNFHSVMFQRGKSAGIGNNRCDGETRRRLVFIQHAEYLRYLFWQADLLLAFAQCRRDKILILIAYLLGLGYSNHMAGFVAGPAVAIAVLVRRPTTLLRWRLLLAGAGALIIGFTPFATQPIRAAYFPAINEGEPTGCRTEFNWDCTFSAQTWEAFKYNFNREQYGKPAVA